MSFDSVLLSFENALWYIAIGLLISGGILVVLSVILNFESFTHAFGIGDHDVAAHDIGTGDHDIGVADHDISVIDHDIGVDHDIAVDHDIGVDHDVSVIDKDISIDKDLSEVHPDGFKDTTHTSAPIFLLLSTYFLMFGILGLSTLQVPSSSIGIRIFRILIIFVSPYLLAVAITYIWRRISKTTVKPLKRGVELVGEMGTVYVPVDNQGGQIHVDLGEGLGVQKLHAKSFDYHKRFEREEEVRIVAVKNRVYLVDTP